MVWNPVTHPFRVRWIYRSSAYGLHGWRDKTAVYATEQEAMLAMHTHDQQAIEKQLDIARLPAEWPKGGWKNLATWKRPKKI